MNASISVSVARKDALAAANQPIPSAVRITALIDTGASGTCVDPSVLKQLAVVPTGQAMVSTPSTGSQPHIADQFDVSIMIPGPTASDQVFSLPNLPVISAELLQQQGFHALIGRDILSMCLFEYNGPARQFTLAY